MYHDTDGSYYRIQCGQDYSPTNQRNDLALTGHPMPRPNIASLSACVDLCMNQGTSCAGVTWEEATLNCYLKSKMLYSGPANTAGAIVDSAIRTRGPTTGGAPQQLIVNGDFSSGALTPWTSTNDQDQIAFQYVNGAAYVYPAISTIQYMTNRITDRTLLAWRQARQPTAVPWSHGHSLCTRQLQVDPATPTTTTTLEQLLLLQRAVATAAAFSSLLVLTLCGPTLSQRPKVLQCTEVVHSRPESPNFVQQYRALAPSTRQRRWTTSPSRCTLQALEQILLRDAKLGLPELLIQRLVNTKPELTVQMYWPGSDLCLNEQRMHSV